jgi:ABC-type transport system involved in multi-copper enzyme maturation permease subunit
MKYLAILKDSFREAIDAKVFYVMLGLSAFVILLVASVSYRPVTLEDEVRTLVGQLSFLSGFQGDRMRLDLTVRDFEQTNDVYEPWRGNYRFTLSAPDPKDKHIREVPQVLVEQILKSRFPWLENVQVTSTKVPEAEEARFRVTTEGTKITSMNEWPHEPSILGFVPLSFMRSSLSYRVFWVEDLLVNGVGAWIAILMGVVITAFFIPNMLRKGTVDLLLVKPVRRVTLLVLKYIGGLTFMFLNSAVAVVGIWLALGLRSGIWATGFLFTIFVLTFFFAILYAVSALFGVLTRSAITAILMTCAIWFVLWIVGIGHAALAAMQDDEAVKKEVQLPEWVHNVVGGVHYVLPRTKDLDFLTSKLISQEVLSPVEIQQLRLDRIPQVSWGESLAVSALFITVMLGLACWRFAYFDF